MRRSRLLIGLIAALGGLITPACNRPSPPPTPVLKTATAGQVAAFCGDCHAVPPATSFPRVDWPREVERGYDFYYQSGRTDLAVPPMQEVIHYYQKAAPAELSFPATEAARLPQIVFHSEQIVFGDEPQPAVAHLNWVGGNLLSCDMASGGVHRTSFNGRSPSSERIAVLSNPCHLEVSDFDADGREDYLAADLGSFLPEDHNRGRVVWLRPGADGSWSQTVLADGLGRVADMRPADVDADGDLDLVVAEFGWHKTGRILLLEQRGVEDGMPQMEVHLVDRRPGTIHVPVADLNGDEQPDFVALISQEHEVVEAFLNMGGQNFERRPIYAANDPSFGSSGLQLVDLDRDADLDVLYTNGDSFDSALPKPYHGVHWLENLGEYPFTHHRLAAMPGVHRAVAGDLDGDGDLDIAAVALLSRAAVQRFPDTIFDSVIWLEQIASGQFLRHVLETGHCDHAVCELGDFDADSDLDLAVGHYKLGQQSKFTESAAVTIWWNESAKEAN